MSPAHDRKVWAETAAASRARESLAKLTGFVFQTLTSDDIYVVEGPRPGIDVLNPFISKMSDIAEWLEENAEQIMSTSRDRPHDKSGNLYYVLQDTEFYNRTSPWLAKAKSIQAAHAFDDEARAAVVAVRMLHVEAEYIKADHDRQAELTAKVAQLSVEQPTVLNEIPEHLEEAS